MIRTTPPARATLSRRRLLTLAAAVAASAALAACGGSTAEATVAPAPDGAPSAPTEALAAPAAPGTLPPGATAGPPTTASPSATPAPAPRPTSIARGTAVFRPQGIINVRQYGAAGDGATDDTAAIQAAIDAVPAVGGTVLFPPGTYIVAPQRTVGIVIKSNLRLAGMGTGSVLKIRDHLGDWQRLLAPRNLGGRVENFTVEDLAFDANIANNPESLIDSTVDTTYQTFIHITAGGNLTVQRCRFAPYSGVWAISFNGSGIQNCAVADCYFQFVMRDGNPDYDNSAVYVEGVNYTFSGNRFESVPMPDRGARACMEAHGGPAEVFNNTATGFQTILNIVGAYNAGGSPGDVYCHDNTCADALQGIMLWPTLPNNLKNVTVANNTIAIAQSKYGPVDTAGIYVLFSPEAKGRAENITIAGNAIRFEDEGAGRAGPFSYNSSGIGLHNLGGVSGVAIDGNTIELAPAAGVAIGLPEPGRRSFDAVRVTNNRIINPGQNLGFPAYFRAGVLVTSTASGIEISGNMIADTFATPRCTAAVAFDPARGKTYRGITVTNNAITAAANLPLILPPGTAR